MTYLANSLTSKQPDFTPLDHVRLLHPIERRGIAAVCMRHAEHWTERVVPITELSAYAAAMRGGTDVYLSQQSFYRWRRISQLAQLGALYSDIDYRNSSYRGEAPEYVCSAILSYLADEHLPTPSYILWTGRGLLAVWLHSLVPRNALPRWNTAQTYLWRTLTQFGADRNAIDAARVFRLTGTHNSKANASDIVRLIWMAADTSLSGMLCEGSN